MQVLNALEELAVNYDSKVSGIREIASGPKNIRRQIYRTLYRNLPYRCKRRIVLRARTKRHKRK